MQATDERAAKFDKLVADLAAQRDAAEAVSAAWQKQYEQALAVIEETEASERLAVIHQLQVRSCVLQQRRSCVLFGNKDAPVCCSATKTPSCVTAETLPSVVLPRRRRVVCAAAMRKESPRRRQARA